MNPNQRAALQATALESTRAYEREAMERIRHMSLALADMEVRGAKRIVPPSSSSNAGGGEGVSDVWFDDSGEPVMAPTQATA